MIFGTIESPKSLSIMQKTCFPKSTQYLKNKLNYQNFETPINNNYVLINNPTINTDKLIIRDNNYIIMKPTDKANCLTKYFANVNNRVRISSSPPLERIINNKFNKFKENIASKNRMGKTVVVFDGVNVATRPTYGDDPGFFCDPVSLRFILRKLNGKKSLGIDRIPNIAIKDLPDPIVESLAILFCSTTVIFQINGNWQK